MKKLLKKRKKYNRRYLLMSQYLQIQNKAKINDKMILLESQQGKTIHGNIFYLLKELLANPNYKGFDIYVSVDKNSVESFKAVLSHYNLQVTLLQKDTRRYLEVLSSAKHLITDTSFMVPFIKKEGQIITNVWHGTPLKTLGKKDNMALHSIGNVQKNFFIADYLLYPNEYTKQHMVEDYMLENICDAKVIINGYPRNEAFFNDVNQDIVDELDIEGKQVIGYMPTWRGAVGKVNHSADAIHTMHYLLMLDKKLEDHQVVLVNLHPFVKAAINFKAFKHIKPFPKQYETYEVLNLCDTLITDYSSVFFDFAVTRKKVILFTYDKEEYLQDRGMYLDIDTLPFPKANTVEELLMEINSDKQYDDKEFVDTYCSKENSNASRQLLDTILLNKGNLECNKVPNNGKGNVLIYTGNLSKNGITTALFNLLSSIDVTKHNYYLTFSTKRVAPHKEILKQLPEGVGYIPNTGLLNASILDKMYIYFTKNTKRKYDYNNTRLARIYRNEIKRLFGDIKFSNVIQYSGYESKRQQLFGRFDAHRIIFVHSNMVKEIETRASQHPNMLRYAYNNYDCVAMVTKDMEEPTRSFCDDKSKLAISHNLIDYKTVENKGDMPFVFDDNTISTKPIEEIQDILDSDAKVFINIGRFSPEKGHHRLMDSFNKIYNEGNDIYLIIVGGHGVIYDKTVEYATTLESSDRIIIIKSLSNPFALLKQCDYFAFTSSHEGFGLVLAEADILGVPVMSTDILGPSGFMKEYGGLLVSDDNQGIYEGMKKLLEGNVDLLDIDYSKYNEIAVAQFEGLLK